MQQGPGRNRRASVGQLHVGEVDAGVPTTFRERPGIRTGSAPELEDVGARWDEPKDVGEERRPRAFAHLR